MSLADCLKKLKVSDDIATEINEIGLDKYQADLIVDLEDLRTQLTEQGFDVPAVAEPLPKTTRELFQEFDATSQSPTDTKGTFSKTDDRILYQDKKTTKRGSIQFIESIGERTKSIISLFEKRNMSTLLHESGHLFLDVLNGIAIQDDAPARYKDMMQDTLDYFNDIEVKRNRKKEEKLAKKKGIEYKPKRYIHSYADVKTEQHERFAREFESYLRTGNAPSANLRDAFDAFSKWLVSVYQDIKNGKIPAKPSSQLSSVFDRLLATDKAIEDVKMENSFQPDPFVLDMMNGTQKQRYLKVKENQLQDARTKLFKRLLKEQKREKTKWYKDAKEKAGRVVDELITEDKIYRYMSLSKDGVLPNGKEIDNLPNLKLSRAEMKNDYPEYIKHLPNHMFAKRGEKSSSITMVADLFGFSNIDKMLMDIINKPSMSKYRSEKIKHLMIASFGDSMVDGTIEQQAFDEMKNSDLTEMKYIELEVVSERASKTIPRKEHYQRYARMQLSKMKLNEIRKEDYYRAEVRAARASANALARGKFEDASTYKEIELINNFMFREARAIKNKQEAKVKYLSKASRKLKKVKGKISIDQEYQSRIEAILGSYFNRDVEPISILELQKWADNENENGAFLDISEFLPLGGDNVADLTVGQFNLLLNTVTAIDTQGRNKHKLFLNGKVEDIEDIETNLLKQLTFTIPQKEKTLSTKVKRFQGVKDGFVWLHNVQIKMRETVKQLDNGENFGIFYNALMRSIDIAQPEMIHKMQVASKEIESIYKGVYGKDGIDGTVEFNVPEIENTAENLNGKVTQEQIVAVLLNMGNEDNYFKLKDGYKWSDVQIDAILKHVRPEDVKYVNAVWKYIDTYWEDVSALEKRRTGFVPEKVIATPSTITVQGKEMQLDGGYYPIAYDKSTLGQQQKDSGVEELKEANMFGMSRLMTRRGHTNERKQKTGLPIGLSLDPFYKHIDSVITDLTMGEALDNSYKVFKRKDLQKELKDRIGEEKTTYMDLWFKDVSVNGLVIGDKGSKIINTVRANTSIVVLSGIKTALVQLSGISHTIVGLGHINTAQATADYIKNPIQTIKFSVANSKVLSERFIHVNRDVSDTQRYLHQTKASNLHKNIVMAGFMPMIAAQFILADIITWNAAYLKASKMMAKGTGNINNEQDIILFADNALSSLQGSGMQKDLSAIERGTMGNTTRLSPLVKLFTMFYSYMNVKYNLAVDQVVMTKRGEQNIALSMLNMSYLFVGETLIGDFLLNNMVGDEDDESVLGYIGGTALSTALGSVAFARDLYGIYKGFSGGSGSLRGMESIAKGVIGTGEEVINIIASDEEMNGYKMARYMISTASYAKGLPTKNIDMILKTEEKRSKGQEVALWDYIRYKK